MSAITSIGPRPPGLGRLRPHPNETAQALTGRRYISFSQITTWRSCPQKYWFQYVLHTEPDFLPATLVFGGAIHAGIEAYFQAAMEGAPVGAADMFEVYRHHWAEQLKQDTPIKFNKDEDLDTLESTAARMFEAFVAAPAARFEGRVVAIEETVYADLHPELPTVMSRVDLAIETDNGIAVVDFKTSRSRWNQSRAVESGDQLLLYRHAALSLSEDPDVDVRLGFVVLTKAKSSTVERFDIPGDALRAERSVRLMLPVWRAIEQGDPYVVPSHMTCPSCPFKSRCPAFVG